MPELPEVATTIAGIRPYFVGKRIEEIRFYDPKLASFPVENVINHTIKDIGRRGKFILFHIEDHQTYGMVVHLRMSGKLLMQDKMETQKHIRMHVITADKTLAFLDIRRMGTVEWRNFKTLDQELGIEPLDNEFSMDYLQKLLQQSQQNLKSFLLDQHKIAGIGNIYASEILFHAGLHPLRLGSSLASFEIEHLFQAIQVVLKQAIEEQGTSIRNYVFADGTNEKKGNFQHFLHVYGKTGQPCSICAQPIQRLKIQGRSTFFCPHCQPLNNKNN